MKVLIIGFSKIMYMPYLFPHLNKYCTEKNKVDLIVWNRDGNKDVKLEYKLNHLYQFEEKLLSENKKYKIRKFINFRKYCINILKNEKYDRVILLHTFPAFLLQKYLVKFYKNKYIFDYKDLTYEKNYLFRKIIEKVVLNSKYTFVSSEGYLNYLPKTNKIYISHNIDYKMLHYRKKRNDKEKEEINISFWGIIRDYLINEKFINGVVKSNKLKLNYYGSQTECSKKLQKMSNDSEKIIFKGAYFNDEKYLFAEETDLLHNAYDNNDFNMAVAMANKFYDGIILYIPQICNKGTLMGDLVEKNGLGTAIDFDDKDFCEKIYKFYQELNYEEFCYNCDKYLEKVLAENEKILNLI